jgi:hypothetical protein
MLESRDRLNRKKLATIRREPCLDGKLPSSEVKKTQLCKGAGRILRYKSVPIDRAGGVEPLANLIVRATAPGRWIFCSQRLQVIECLL